MNSITTCVEHAPTYSSAPSWRAIAILNGRRTSMCCMHSHSRQDLAEKCAGKYFLKIIAPLPNAELVDIGHGQFEARWTDNHNRNVTRRFHYQPESRNK